MVINVVTERTIKEVTITLTREETGNLIDGLAMVVNFSHSFDRKQFAMKLRDQVTLALLGHQEPAV